MTSTQAQIYCYFGREWYPRSQKVDLICFQKSGCGTSKKSVYEKKEGGKFRFEGAIGVDRYLREDPQRHQVSCCHRDIHSCHHFRIQNRRSLGTEPFLNGHMFTVQKQHIEEHENVHAGELCGDQKSLSQGGLWPAVTFFPPTLEMEEM